MKRSKFELKEWRVTVSDSTAYLQLKYSISTEYIIYATLIGPDGEPIGSWPLNPYKNIAYLPMTPHSEATPVGGEYRLIVEEISEGYTKHQKIFEKTFTFSGPKIDVKNVEIEWKKKEEGEYSKEIYPAMKISAEISNTGDLPAFIFGEGKTEEPGVFFDSKVMPVLPGEKTTISWEKVFYDFGGFYSGENFLSNFIVKLYLSKGWRENEEIYEKTFTFSGPKIVIGNIEIKWLGYKVGQYPTSIFKSGYTSAEVKVEVSNTGDFPVMGHVEASIRKEQYWEGLTPWAGGEKFGTILPGEKTTLSWERKFTIEPVEPGIYTLELEIHQEKTFGSVVLAERTLTITVPAP